MIINKWILQQFVRLFPDQFFCLLFHLFPTFSPRCAKKLPVKRRGPIRPNERRFIVPVLMLSNTLAKYVQLSISKFGVTILPNKGPPYTTTTIFFVGPFGRRSFFTLCLLLFRDFFFWRAFDFSREWPYQRHWVFPPSWGVEIARWPIWTKQKKRHETLIMFNSLKVLIYI